MYAVRVTRPVAEDAPHNHIGRDVALGEVFYVFTAHTYGVIDELGGGIALTENRDQTYPFFEFPRDAIEEA